MSEQRTRPDRLRRVSLLLGGAAALSGALSLAGALSPFLSAASWADTPGFELYCPGTPVGNVVLNNVVVTGALSTASPGAGQQFTLGNFQVQANIPASLATAAQALGNTAVSGNATVTVDVSGATPASVSSGSLSFNSPLPPSGTQVPSSGISLSVPPSPGSVGPFTAAGGPITLTVDKSASLTLLVSGSPLNLTCTAYPNDTVPSGITSASPSGSPISPTVVTTGAGGATSSGSAGGAPAGTAASSSGAGPATAAGGSASGSLAFTGPSTGLYIAGGVGLLLVDLGYLLLTAVDRPRRLLFRAAGRIGRSFGIRR